MFNIDPPWAVRYGLSEVVRCAIVTTVIRPLPDHPTIARPSNYYPTIRPFANVVPPFMVIGRPNDPTQQYVSTALMATMHYNKQQSRYNVGKNVAMQCTQQS
ncbi:hypothetical protein M422DRAFT_23594 [Sphaerobolus stellatus SS14]|nr:hypothetical protein M422DRAFT_23594 [Sphaerobolus stellatus SS14]